MPLKVEVHPEAVAEAEAAKLWYEARSHKAAHGFLAELDRAIEQISNAPDRWPNYLHGTRRFLLRRYPFSIVYRQVGNSIDLVAVAHARRKPGYWASR